MSYRIEVYGTPGPQGSKRFVGHAKSGRGIMVESSKKVAPWREAVKYAAREVVKSRIAGPISVKMYFTLRKPASAPRSRTTYPDKKPDLSKCVRSTEDSLTDAGVWEDDARVVECLSMKVFPGEHPYSLPSPGVVILISEYSSLERK